MTTNIVKRNTINRKIISISKKRQITIPLQFYKSLELGNEAECTLENGKLVIRPIRLEPSEFSVEILKDLVAQGYSGKKLVQAFEDQSKKVKQAVTCMLKEADAIAAGEIKTAGFDDIFGAGD